MRDTLGPIYSNPDFAALFPKRSQPAYAPAHLTLVTIMQFAEDLSDRQAADAVRASIDWKYLLALKLDDPGFDTSVLSEFRTRLLQTGNQALLFELLLTSVPLDITAPASHLAVTGDALGVGNRPEH